MASLPRETLVRINHNFMYRLKLMISDQYMEMITRIFDEGHLEHGKGAVGAIYKNLDELEKMEEMKIAFIPEQQLRGLDDNNLHDKLASFDPTQKLTLVLSVWLPEFGFVTTSAECPREV